LSTPEVKIEIFFKFIYMYKIGLIVLAALLTLSTGCGRLKQGNTQGNEQQSPGMGGNGRGNFGGGPGQFSPEDMAKRQVEMLGEYVKFTDDQKTKILEVYKKYGEKMTEMRSGRSFRDMSDEERQEMRTKMETINTEREKEIKGLLSAEQLGQYEDYQKEMEQRRTERMQQRQPQN
jgi:hypothetical protein